MKEVEEVEDSERERFPSGGDLSDEDCPCGEAKEVIGYAGGVDPRGDAELRAVG